MAASMNDRPTLRGRIGKAVAAQLPRSVVVLRGDRSVRGVALTFDDGPDALTHEYLALLDRLKVRATFFLVGTSCEERPHDVREIVARGHEVATHGYTHRAFPELDRAALREELRLSLRSIPPMPQSRPFVRPPRGATSMRSLLACAAEGFRTVLWSLDSDDCRTTSPELVASRVATAQAGEIVLLHEGQSWTLEALPTIVEELRSRGLEPMTVSELL